MMLIDIYRRRRRDLEHYLRRLLGNGDDAADLTQEAFLRVYAAEVGDRTPAGEALLYTVARNLALSELRKRTSRATDSAGDLADLEVADARADPEALAGHRQRLAAVEAAMARMPPKCLEVFRLRKLDGLSQAEIAIRLGITTHTVERHITRALQLCHQALTESRGAAGAPGRARGEPR
ncbi:MAG: RNA polymerase sigma factor [Burkholderiales bacterium]|nr:RNA polymerase sigma factor [Burkholderiales bacterium]